MGEFVAKKYDNTSHMVWWNGHGMICRTDSLGNAARIADALNAQAAPSAAVPADDAIEAAYWDFDARHKGYGPHKITPQSERDAFKWAVRALLAAAPAQQPAAAVPEGFAALVDAADIAYDRSAEGVAYVEFYRREPAEKLLAACRAMLAAAARKGVDDAR